MITILVDHLAQIDVLNGRSGYLTALSTAHHMNTIHANAF
ncbi:hypothetical protein AAKU55_004859 [Oxalobacteraceae bacterium GrIS 1.11]